MQNLGHSIDKISNSYSQGGFCVLPVKSLNRIPAIIFDESKTVEIVQHSTNAERFQQYARNDLKFYAGSAFGDVITIIGGYATTVLGGAMVSVGAEGQIGADAASASAIILSCLGNACW